MLIDDAISCAAGILISLVTSQIGQASLEFDRLLFVPHLYLSSHSSSVENIIQVRDLFFTQL